MMATSITQNMPKAAIRVSSPAAGSPDDEQRVPGRDRHGPQGCQGRQSRGGQRRHRCKIERGGLLGHRYTQGGDPDVIRERAGEPKRDVDGGAHPKPSHVRTGPDDDTGRILAEDERTRISSAPISGIGSVLSVPGSPKRSMAKARLVAGICARVSWLITPP